MHVAPGVLIGDVSAPEFCDLRRAVQATGFRVGSEDENRHLAIASREPVSLVALSRSSPERLRRLKQLRNESGDRRLMVVTGRWWGSETRELVREKIANVRWYEFEPGCWDRAPSEVFRAWLAGTVIVRTSSRRGYEAWSALLAGWNLATVWLPPPSPIVARGALALVLDERADEASIGWAKKNAQDVPVFVAASFVRPSEAVALRRAGAADVLARPLSSAVLDRFARSLDALALRGAKSSSS